MLQHGQEHGAYISDTPLSTFIDDEYWRRLATTTDLEIVLDAYETSLRWESVFRKTGKPPQGKRSTSPSKDQPPPS